MTDSIAVKSSRKYKIHKADIPPERIELVIKRVNEGMDKSHMEKDIATYVKKKCDEEFGGTWHCIVGRNFGCSITHDTKYVLFMHVELMHVLLFKSFE